MTSHIWEPCSSELQTRHLCHNSELIFEIILVDNLLVLRRDIKFVIPRNCHNLDDMRIPQWTNAVQDQLRFISNLSTMECKLKFIGSSII